MNSKHTLKRLGSRVALLAVLAVAALGTAAAASALPAPGDDGTSDPPLPAPKPNLVFSDASIGYGTTVNDWVISYTVANRGSAPAGAFHVTAQQDGTAMLKDSYQAGLAAGASRSETIHILRTSCYIAVRFTADSGHVVAESSEADNVRWAVGLTSTSCPSQPKYTVKAVSFHANDETGIDFLGSDEPYWVFNGVGMTGTDRSTVSHTFGDIDSGDTASFNADEGCMYISCSGGAAPLGMGFSVQLWEHDLGYVPWILRDTSIAFHEVGGFIVGQGDNLWLGTASNKIGDAIDQIIAWAEDDFLASQTYTYSPVYLASRLAAVGSSFSDVRSYSGGGGDYTMTTVVSRVG
jgi:hypothetical protein